MISLRFLVNQPKHLPSSALLQCWYSSKSSKKHGKASPSKQQAPKKQQQHESNGDEAGEFDLDKYKLRMQHIVDKYREELASIRLGRATPSLLDTVRVPYEGTQVRINQLARIVVKDPQTLHVIPSDASSETMGLIEKAIRNANLNLNPVSQTSGQDYIRVPIPPITQEYRIQMQKQLGQICEQAKIRIRQHRQQARTHLKRHPMQSLEDDARMEKSVQTVTDSMTVQLDSLTKVKSKEILSQ